MRNNQPVTNNEYVLKDGTSLVSKTDTKGRITYFNPAFAETSGFSDSELMGAPHNLVRHPDMPEEAFADLWETLKQGHPWNAIIKNRRKNGDFYWVQANATPVRENGKVVGYMSVRNKVSPEQIQETAALYARFKSGNAGNIRFKRGQIVPTGLAGCFAALRNIGLGMRIGISMAILNLLILGMGGLSILSAEPDEVNSFVVATVIGTLLTLCIWFFLHKAIVGPLRTLIAGANTMAGGDLTVSFDTNRSDDMGQLQKAIQQMNINLRSVIGDVCMNVASINVATREIASGNMDLSGRTEAQASSLEETASSMEELASTVKQTADHASQANRLTLSASEVAGKGGSAVQNVSATMNEISTSAKRIVDIIGLIDGIAFQTNILALNAAVEAARAGEQGRGFAVVAAEVRSLAQRSAGAAKEIKTLIDDSVQKVETGNQLVGSAIATMGEIVQSVQQVTDIMNEIATATREQGNGIDQVNMAVTQMDETTQQNAALVEQSAAAAKSLEEQTLQLLRSISVFRTGREQDAHNGPAIVDAGVSTRRKMLPR
ncbi:MAG TPA: methyl-accepting chemotaxis protein [Oxalicibacterium sp.]